MPKLAVFNNISLDGYFVDAQGSMAWAHPTAEDAEFDAFTAQNASGGGVLVFGRITYEMMAEFWPSQQAKAMMPIVAEGMNRREKIVFSRSLASADWSNTRLEKDDPATEMRKLKSAPGDDMVILGSGSIVAQLAHANLIDEYQFMIVPVVLGSGRTLFEGLANRHNLKLTKSRAFANGRVFVSYEPPTG